MSDLGNSMHLRGCVASIPLDRILAITPNSTCRFGDVLGSAGAGGESPYVGKSIALVSTDIVKAIRGLVAFDGTASAILLCSGSIAEQSIKLVANAAACDLIVCDRHCGSRDLGIPCDDLRTALEFPAAEPRSNQVSQLTQWLLTTSGTAGAPKVVSHTFHTLTKTVKADVAYGETVRWGLLYDFTRFAGLQVVLQSVLSGSTLLAPDLKQSLQDQLDFLSRHNCTHLSATPTLWRKILMTSESARLTLRQVTLGGEIADQRILTALRERFPIARITHIYASTEAGVGFSVNDCIEGFPVSFLESPPMGIRLRIREGRLFVYNNEVVPAYIGSSEVFSDKDGFVDTGDGVELRDGRYRFLGRVNGAINVGGNRVFPEKVEQVLLRLDGVRCARVFGRPNPITGQIVAAEVVAADAVSGDSSELRRRIQKHCAENLSRIEVPVAISFVTEIAVSGAGKMVRGAK